MKRKMEVKKQVKMTGVFALVGALLFAVSCGPKTTEQVVEFEEDLTTRDSITSGEDSSSTDDYFEPEATIYQDQVFAPNIKTVQLTKEGVDLSAPFLFMGSQERLELRFDDLDADVKDYRFTMVHCEFNWKPSDLIPGDYIDGFQDDYISEHEFSANTLVKYTHYRATFPNENIRLTKSGNYVVRVYIEGQPENTILTKRFFVCEQVVNVEPTFKRPVVFEDKNYRQEIDFTIFHKSVRLPNPYTDLNVLLMQNRRWDNASRTLKPLFVKDGELVYDYDDQNVFDGGNEFRHVDLKSMRFKDQTVIESITRDSLGFFVTLVPDERRSFKRYMDMPDINGNYLVRNSEGIDPIIGADYVRVHFKLPYPAPVTDGNLYVFGAITDWQFKDEFQLKYNYDSGMFECITTVKQGYFDYSYVFVEDGKPAGDISFVEGTHFQTENEYSILVYYKDQTLRFDRLLAWKSFKTRS